MVKTKASPANDPPKQLLSRCYLMVDVCLQSKTTTNTEGPTGRVCIMCGIVLSKRAYFACLLGLVKQSQFEKRGRIFVEISKFGSH